MKLNYIKLILANIIILCLFLIVLFMLPEDYKINLTFLFMYVSSATLFNILIIEKE